MVALGLPGTARALDIPEFDQMPVERQNDFGRFLIRGLIHWLIANQRSDDAERLTELFGLADGFSAEATGYRHWKDNLQLVREMNAERSRAGKQPYSVEHAFALTLKDAGIKMSLEDIADAGKRFQAVPRFRFNGP
jgi:hypothetical protein